MIAKILSQARGALFRLVHVLRLTLGEIFDEAAYARYLQRARAEASRESYAAFLAEKHRAQAAATRCC